ncbi:cytochrome c biogenesis factor-like protein [Sphingomonas sp. JC676]|nr:cytochrome c biogenesis factor-like protein [Sphingomonas sp. JC676]
MGWLLLLAIALVTVLVLWRTGYPRKLWTIPATALMLGAAGYAWQGSPGLAGHPVAAEAQAGQLDPDLVALREAIFGKFGTNAWSYAMAADRMTLSGKPDLAIAVWQGAVRKMPNDVALWSGYGLALAEHDGNQVSPASRFAFERAMTLWPQHPGPPFFYGLALIREGKYAEARTFWLKAVQLTSEKASYRGELVLRLFLLDRLLAAKAGQAGPQPAPTPAKP